MLVSTGGFRPRHHRTVVRCGRRAVGPAGARGAGHRRSRPSDRLPISSADPTPIVGFEPGAVPGPPPVSDEAEVDGTPQIVAVSPAVDEPAPQEHEIAAVVSAPLKPDITPVVDLVGSPPTSTADASTSTADASPSPNLSSPSAETGVTAPGLSPGDDRADGQHHGSPGRASGDERIGATVDRAGADLFGRSAPTGPSSSSSPEAPVLDSDSPRYQD